MTWIIALIAWTLISFVASPLIGRALASGRHIHIREATSYDQAMVPDQMRHTI